MDAVTKHQIESELKSFTSRNFADPSDCRNLEQIRFYIQELCRKIEDLERSFNYVPTSAYQLLARYNAKQNALIHFDFRKEYHS